MPFEAKMRMKNIGRFVFISIDIKHVGRLQHFMQQIFKVYHM